MIRLQRPLGCAGFDSHKETLEARVYHSPGLISGEGWELLSSISTCVVAPSQKDSMSSTALRLSEHRNQAFQFNGVNTNKERHTFGINHPRVRNVCHFDRLVISLENSACTDCS